MLALLTPHFTAQQDFTSLMIVGGTPAGNFRDGAVTTQTDVVVVEAAVADTGAGHRVRQAAYFFHRSAALSSVTRVSTQRPPCGVISFFQNGAWVFR